MSLSDRFSDERNTRTQAEIDEAETNVSRVDELRQHLRDTARLVANELAKMGLLDPHGLPGCDSRGEVIEGAAEEADELFDKLLWKERFEQEQLIADGEY